MERKPRKKEEHSRIKCAIIDPSLSSSPSAWLSQGIVDCRLSEGRPKLTQAEEDRFQRLRDAQSAFIGNRQHGLYTEQGVNSGFDLYEEMFSEDLAEETAKDAERYAFEKTPQAGVDEEGGCDADGDLNPVPDADDSEVNTEYDVAIAGDGARLYCLHSLTRKQIKVETGLTQAAVSKQLTKVRAMRMGYIAAKKTVGNDNNTRKAVIK
jgi:hypothetical protein